MIMARIPKLAVVDDDDPDAEDKKILLEAKDNFARWENWESDFRHRYIQDVKFANGDSDNGWQWPHDLRADREANKRPALTINKVQRLVAMITNDASENKPAITIKPTGNESSYKSAQVYEGLIRDIEYKSSAQTIYDNCSVSQVEGGIAYFRIEQVYTDDDSFDQELRITPVRDHLGVFLDCDIKQMDGSDALWGGVFDDMPREEFEKLNPDLDLDQIGSQTIFGGDIPDAWLKEDSIRIAEYYRIIQSNDTLYWVEDEKGQVATFKKSEAPEGFEKTLVTGKYKKRKIINRTLEWYKIVGNKIIDRRSIATDNPLKGRYIPIIRMVGIERIIDGKLERKGYVRALKDPQRMLNFNAPLALDTALPTPNGWTTMRDVKHGDWLFDENGNPVQVAGVSPIFLHRKCFNVVFDDGTSIIADDCHKWTVEERGKRKTAGVEWIKKTIITSELKNNKHYIYSTKPLELPLSELPIHPYILGAWLGDGSATGGMIYSEAVDAESMKKNIEACGYSVGKPHISKTGTCIGLSVLGIRNHLVNLGVFSNKHIPASYLRASREQRLMLLRGLMDTDGCAANSRLCVFINGNKYIADGFCELLRSLGIKMCRSTIDSQARMFPGGQMRECQEYYRISFTAPFELGPMFWLSRKVGKQKIPSVVHPRRTKRIGIKSVTEVPSVPVKCVSINSDSHLFLAGIGMVPTHNSQQVEGVSLQTKTPWVGPAAAFEGNEVAWNNANRQNAAYLTYKHQDGDGNQLPAPQRLEPPKSADGFLQGFQLADSQLAMVGGREDAGLGREGQEKSGVAIQQRQRMGDKANQIWLTNEAIALTYAGRIIIDLVPHIYDTARVIQIMGEDGTQSKVTLDPSAPDAYQEITEQDVTNVLFNPTVGKYEVMSAPGPAYATQRQEAWNAFVNIVTGAPALIDEIGDLMFKSADFPLADKIAERLRRKIKANAPYLLDDNAPAPQIAQMQQALQAAQGQIGELIEKLAEKNLELKNKDSENDIKRFEADSHRLTAETNSIVDLKKSQFELHQLLMTITQTLNDMKNDNMDRESDRSDPVTEINDQQRESAEGSDPLVEQNDIPPFEGAVKSAQGIWQNQQ